jgi:hypothetical protein
MYNRYETGNLIRNVAESDDTLTWLFLGILIFAVVYSFYFYQKKVEKLTPSDLLQRYGKRKQPM